MNNICSGASDGETLPFTNAEELATLNGTTKFGCVLGGSTYAFFAKSNNPTYKRIYERMVADPSTLVHTISEGIWRINAKKSSPFLTTLFVGIDRVREGDYAFFMESSTIEYTVQRYCGLEQVGGLLDLKGWFVNDRLMQRCLIFYSF